MKDIVLGLVRHVLGALGAAAVTKGVLEAGQVETAVGALMALVAVALSIKDKLKK